MLATMDTGSGNFSLNEVFFIMSTSLLAMGGLDYNVTMENITLIPAEPLQCVEIDITGDSILESRETFAVQIVMEPSEDMITLSPDSVNITIEGIET